MKHRSLEVLQATYIAILAEGVAIVLFCGMIAVWIIVGATSAKSDELSATGSAIEVENYRCWVKSPRSIVCMNIGRVCEAFRAREKLHDEKIFGCALETSKNYPCPPWEETMKHSDSTRDERMVCTQTSFGFW